MKKILLLSSLIASLTTMSEVTGYIEGTAKGKVEFEQNDTKGSIDKLGIKGEFKTKNVTIGAFLGNEDFENISKENHLTKERYLENFLDKSNVYIQYDIPKMKQTESYIKLTLNPKEKEYNFKKGNVQLEGQAKHQFNNDLIFGVNTKLTLPFEIEKIRSEHILTIEKNKLEKIEDLKASLTLKHGYLKKGNVAVNLDTKLKYAKVNIEGELDFVYQIEGTSKVKNILTDAKQELNENSYAHSYKLATKYEVRKDLELMATAKLQHIHYENASLDKITPFDQMSVYETKEERQQKLKKVEDATKELKAIENQKEEYEKAKKAVENAIKGIGDYLRETERQKKEEYDKVKDESTVKQYVAIYNEKEILDKEVDKLEFKLIDIDNLKNVNETVKKAKRDEINKKLEKIGEKTNELKSKLDSISGNSTDHTKKASDYLLAKKNFDRYKADNNNFVRGHVNSYLFDENGIHYDNENEKSKNKKTIEQIEKELKENNYYKKKEALDNANAELKPNKKEYDLFNSVKAKADLVNFGLETKIKYTGVKNLTIMVDGVLGGMYHSEFKTFRNYPSYTSSYAKLNLGAKYDFDWISPELNVTTKFVNLVPELVIAPKVSTEYSINKLDLKISSELPIKFGESKFKYLSTGIKVDANLKYTW
ncbi:hypothetical protein QQA45_06260 [Sneathia sanguinegens]|uniref:Uncharacterized protein n=1 Tax=Sneathia sanguinegens TaxID=40543 RepID=A0ABT7HLK5_9FUSO|nr:hypothetical protein [Sneathia sanguinegens]MDK9581094.1 hypothetical protein [Sneathia sanguinegens]